MNNSLLQDSGKAATSRTPPLAFSLKLSANTSLGLEMIMRKGANPTHIFTRIGVLGMELYLKLVGYGGFLLLLLGIGFVGNGELELYLLYGYVNQGE